MPASPEQYVSYSLFWFTLSLVNAGLAQAKHRSGLGWWVASLFFGPIATLLIVVLPRGSSAPADQQPLTTTQMVIVALIAALAFLAIVALLLGVGAR